ncbi:hypothetical protein [Thalassotalea sp. PLHSN55]|uniref:hypothetical protein n=1 Tax=Thalassotalea sp. PLHSN55 TaxID=3435888 RepID=UPI003F8374B3
MINLRLVYKRSLVLLFAFLTLFTITPYIVFPIYLEQQGRPSIARAITEFYKGFFNSLDDSNPYKIVWMDYARTKCLSYPKTCNIKDVEPAQ